MSLWMQWKNQITPSFILTLIVGLIVIGGGWYSVTSVIPAQVEDLRENQWYHINKEYKPLNQEFRLLKMEAVPREDLDGFVKEDDVEALKELMREIQSNQKRRMDEQRERLDYIIERLDDR